MAIAAAAPAGAQTSARDFEAYLAELASPAAHYVVVSNHFRHDVDCTSKGCVVMGPMEDRAACEDWSKRYNRVDPFDHTRCVVADP
ncbi:MAG: hypothetical protein AAFR16_12980 [Pseudomonadota bacterium]